MEKEALEFARKAHAEQKRKFTEEPYIEHPKRVAELVRTVPHTPEMICAAYLHDVVEDTPISLEEIKKRFGNEVAELVEELTDEYMTEKYPHLNRKLRKEKEVERQAEMSIQAKTIKLADVIDNTRDIVGNDENFARRLLPEMEALTNVLRQGDTRLFEQAWHEVQHGKQVLQEKSRKVY
jgi:guanosine-3',5'-bis(diphosphate) 3'-pyrophosphohydrolase